MDISEDVLFNTLAQIGKKELKDANQKYQHDQKAFEVYRNEKEPIEKVDTQKELERKIIELLLLYGNETEDFQDLILKNDDVGELILEPETYTAKVFEKIYLDLQQDEVELSNPIFRKIYSELIVKLNEEESFSIENFVNQTAPDIASEVTSILMDDEKYILHDWDRKNIFVKEKSKVISQLVSETILSLRCHLIEKRVEVLQQEVVEKKDDNHEVLEEIMNYHLLKKLLSKKLNRVL
jgi:DNA primase